MAGRSKQRTAKRGPAAYLFWVLSDVHINAADETVEGRCEKIARDFVEAMQRITGHFQDDVHAGLLLVGDLTHASARADYDLFTKCVLTPFRNGLGDNVAVYAVPGNHDHLRDAIPVDAAAKEAKTDPQPTLLHPKMIVDHYRRAGVASRTNEWEHRVGSRFFLFDQWSRNNTSVGSEKTAGPWKTIVPTSDKKAGFVLQLVGINSAIASDGSGDEKKLWIHDGQVRQVLTEEPVNGTVTLSLLHHAPDRDLDERDREALNLLYTRSTVILHGHYHERGGEPARPGRPPILRAPALGHPMPTSGVDANKRDGCAILRVLPDRAQMFFLSHRQPENDEAMKVEYGKDVDGSPCPDIDLTYAPNPKIATVGK